MTPPQTSAGFLDGHRPTVLSLVVTPRETRPIERQSSSGGATARDWRSDGGPEGERRTDAGTLASRERSAPAYTPISRNLNMVFDEKSGRPIIEILHPRTGEVVDRIPPESLAERARRTELPARANLVDETA